MKKISLVLMILFGLFVFGSIEARAILPGGGCEWCGLLCMSADSERACTLIAPPEGATCVEVNGVCTIKKDDLNPTVTPGSGCAYLWWFDSTNNTSCSIKQFCGSYVYKGLNTFKTKAECLTVLGSSATRPTCVPRPGCLDATYPCKIAEPMGGWCPIGITPTPSLASTMTPGVMCKTGVNSFAVSTTCGVGTYRYASYQCYDGTVGKLGGETSCKSSLTWRKYANDACMNKSSCVGPTVSPVPTTVVSTPPLCRTCSYGNKLAGDANCDSKVDLADFATWKGEYIGKSGLKADFNCDGKVDLADFATWKGEYLKNNN